MWCAGEGRGGGGSAGGSQDGGGSAGGGGGGGEEGAAGRTHAAGEVWDHPQWQQSQAETLEKRGDYCDSCCGVSLLSWWNLKVSWMMRSGWNTGEKGWLLWQLLWCVSVVMVKFLTVLNDKAKFKHWRKEGTAVTFVVVVCLCCHGEVWKYLQWQQSWI